MGLRPLSPLYILPQNLYFILLNFLNQKIQSTISFEVSKIMEILFFGIMVAKPQLLVIISDFDPPRTCSSAPDYLGRVVA